MNLPRTFVLFTVATISTASAQELWTIESQNDWQAHTAAQTNLDMKDGLAAPTPASITPPPPVAAGVPPPVPEVVVPPLPPVSPPVEMVFSSSPSPDEQDDDDAAAPIGVTDHLLDGGSINLTDGREKCPLIGMWNGILIQE